MRATAGRRGAKGLSQRRPFGRRHSAVSDLREALARRYDARGQADLVLISESIAPCGVSSSRLVAHRSRLRPPEAATMDPTASPPSTEERALLGPDHPATVAARNDLGVLLRKNGRYAEAESIFRGVLAAHKRRHGREHPVRPW